MIKLTINRHREPKTEYSVSISVDKEIQQVKMYDSLQEAYNHVKRIQTEIPMVKLEVSQELLEDLLDISLYIVEEL